MGTGCTQRTVFPMIQRGKLVTTPSARPCSERLLGVRPRPGPSSPVPAPPGQALCTPTPRAPGRCVSCPAAAFPPRMIHFGSLPGLRMLDSPVLCSSCETPGWSSHYGLGGDNARGPAILCAKGCSAGPPASTPDARSITGQDSSDVWTLSHVPGGRLTG